MDISNRTFEISYPESPFSKHDLLKAVLSRLKVYSLASTDSVHSNFCKGDGKYFLELIQNYDKCCVTENLTSSMKVISFIGRAFWTEFYSKHTLTPKFLTSLKCYSKFWSTSPWCPAFQHLLHLYKYIKNVRKVCHISVSSIYLMSKFEMTLKQNFLVRLSKALFNEKTSKLLYAEVNFCANFPIFT